MYYRHNLPCEYPEKCDAHVISVKRLFVDLNIGDPTYTPIWI